MTRGIIQPGATGPTMTPGDAEVGPNEYPGEEDPGEPCDRQSCKNRWCAGNPGRGHDSLSEVVVDEIVHGAVSSTTVR